MNAIQSMKVAAALALAATLSACASYQPPFPIPDDPGLYALSPNDDLQRLDGNRTWEVDTWSSRANLSPRTEFVILDPTLSGNPERIELWRVAWVRSEIDNSNLAMPISGTSWAVAPIAAQRVPITLDPAPKTPDAVHIVPAKLEPGLYALRLNANGNVREARIGILWDSVDKRRYSAVNCVDRHAGGYQLCTSATAASSPQPVAADGLDITLADPVRDGNRLIVQGLVTNRSGVAMPVPPMQVTLQDKAGQELSRQVITQQSGPLAPGQQLTFKSELLRPMGAAKVNVNFVADPNIAAQ